MSSTQPTRSAPPIVCDHCWTHPVDTPGAPPSFATDSVFCPHNEAWAVWMGDHWFVRRGVTPDEYRGQRDAAFEVSRLIAVAYEAGVRVGIDLARKPLDDADAR